MNWVVIITFENYWTPKFVTFWLLTYQWDRKYFGCSCFFLLWWSSTGVILRVSDIMLGLVDQSVSQYAWVDFWDGFWGCSLDKREEEFALAFGANLEIVLLKIWYTIWFYLPFLVKWKLGISVSVYFWTLDLRASLLYHCLENLSTLLNCGIRKGEFSIMFFLLSYLCIYFQHPGSLSFHVHFKISMSISAKSSHFDRLRWIGRSVWRSTVVSTIAHFQIHGNRLSFHLYRSF